MPDNEVKLRITADSSGVEEGANQAKENIDKASASVSILADLLGVKVPDGIQKLIASSELLGPIMEEALPVVVAGALVKEMHDLYEEHKLVTAAIHGQSEAWQNLDRTVSQFSDDAHIRLLEVQERIDAVTGHSLKALKDRLILIDAVSFDHLKQQFQAIGDEANKAFLGMEESGFKAFLFRETGAQEGIKNIADNFRLMMDQIKSMENAHDMAGIGQLLDQQIAKTKDAIKTDHEGGTSSTPQIIAANERLLQVLSDLKGAYSDVQQVANSEKQLANQESIKGNQRQVQMIEVQTQKSRIDTTQQASQQVVADYEKSFTEINAATQQFNNQQLSILMTGINKTSTQVVLANQNTSKKIEADEAASLSRRQKLWDQTFKGITGAFDTFINGILSGHQKLSQAWTKLVDGMVSKFVEGLEKQLMSFIEHKLMELSIHTSTEQAKDVVSRESHAKEDLRTAYSAAKGAWESVVHTPIVGPILAPIAAATTFAAVSAFGSAEGGQYIVPSEQLTMLHRNEMVLPAGVADRMRGVIDGGGGGGATVVVNHSVSAVDAESFQSHIRRHANLIGNEVARVLKKKSS